MRSCSRLATPAALALSIALVPALASAAENWPLEKPVRIVVPYPAGGTADIIARTLSKGLAEKLKANAVVENKAGASGNIGAQLVAKAEGDGYTLMIGGPNNFASNQFIYTNLNYSIEKDLVGISLLAESPNALLVPSSMKATDVKQFVAASTAKAHPLNCASTGVATMNHLMLEQFRLQTGASMQHIPLKGSADVIVELLGNHVDCAFDNVAPHVANLGQGRYRVLAVTGQSRASYLPDVPTLAELGYPDTGTTAWFALAAPSSTPAPLVDKISKAVREVLADPAIAASFQSLRFVPLGTTPEKTAAFIRQEAIKWKGVIDAAHITAQ